MDSPLQKIHICNQSILKDSKLLFQEHWMLPFSFHLLVNKVNIIFKNRFVCMGRVFGQFYSLANFITYSLHLFKKAVYSLEQTGFILATFLVTEQGTPFEPPTPRVTPEIRGPTLIKGQT